MECTCGITYPDDGKIWSEVHISVPVPYPHDGEDNVCSLFYAVCPECSEIGLKLNHAPKFSDHYWLDPFVENVKNAIHIYPHLTTPERREIPLDGVPESDCSDYRKALIALDNPDLYEFANIVARRSLERILRTNYTGRTLSDLIDQLLKDQDNGLSRGLLINIDAIRNLGNMGAHDIEDDEHEVLRADKDQTQWNMTVWERVLEEWYVRPAQDAAQLSKLQDAGLKVKLPSS